MGVYYDSSNSLHGFLYDGNTWTTLDDPFAVFSSFHGSTAAGISGSNIVGNYSDSLGVAHGSLYDGSAWTNDGTNNFLNMASTAGNRFFRLSHP